MNIIIKAKCIKCNFKNGEFRIFGWSPVGDEFKKTDIKLSPYFTFSTKGDDSYISEGKEYELELEEISFDSRWGGTYRIISVPSISGENLEDISKEESVLILKEITTESQANNILDAYPNFIWLALTQGKEAFDINKIYNVGEFRLNAYIRELCIKYKYLNLMNKLKNFKVDIKECKELYNIYSKEEIIEKALNDTPYKVLMGDLERSFESVDKLIMELRPDLQHSEQRCSYLILSVLLRNEEYGNSKLDANDLYNYIMNEYPQANDIEDLIVPTVLNNELFYYEEKTKYLAIMSTYLAECRIADFVKSKIKESHKLDIDYKKYQETDGFKMTDNQLNCLKNFCDYDFSILAGFSGSGKTASVKGLISLMDDNGMTYTLLSPTGKASKVLAESTGRTASTIHKRCYSGEIDTDCVIIDECGMVSLSVFIMLLDAITNPNIKVVLVGDPAQLSAIGLSKIFDDLINSNKVPITMLTEIFRYKSNGSLYVATNIRQGNSFFNDTEMVLKKDNIYKIGDNYKFIEVEDDSIIETVVAEYRNLINKGIKKQDIMVLSPFNVRDMGTYAINTALQAEFNPPKPNEKVLTKKINSVNIIFREGDIVINTKNDYTAVTYNSYLIMKEQGLSEEDVADSIVVNGQIGIVRQVLDDGLCVQYDEELMYISKSKLNHLLLAYAISTHKSQGSSIDYVISVVSNQHKKMHSRGLFYVADTRCRKSCIDIGSIEAFENALKVVDNDLRLTWLLNLMIE